MVHDIRRVSSLFLLSTVSLSSLPPLSLSSSISALSLAVVSVVFRCRSCVLLLLWRSGCCVLFVCCCCLYFSSSSLIFPVTNASGARELVISIKIFLFLSIAYQNCAREVPNEPP